MDSVVAGRRGWIWDIENTLGMKQGWGGLVISQESLGHEAGVGVGWGGEEVW